MPQAFTLCRGAAEPFERPTLRSPNSGPHSERGIALILVSTVLPGFSARKVRLRLEYLSRTMCGMMRDFAATAFNLSELS